MAKTKKLTNEDLEEDRERSLNEKLTSLKENSLEKVTESRAQALGIPYINLKGFPVDKEALLLISEEDSKLGKIIPFYEKDNILKIAVVDVNNQKTEEIVSSLKKKEFEISIFLISEVGFRYAFNFYSKILVTKKTIEKVEISEKELEKARSMIGSVSDLRSLIRKVSTTEIINIIFAGAMLTNSSDIHIEPEEEEVALRYRIDGVLQEVTKVSQKAYPKILSRIKYLARLKLNVTDIPQDGRFTITSGDKEIDIRVSVLPSGYGESIVMRLLGVGALKLKLDDLGFRERELKLLKKEIAKPTGLILTTGPTGSGKTTTLYSCLNEVKSSAIKIITLENPIEYRLEGIVQTQIDEKKGMTFANGLRSILRQDPDIIMVGEIRDYDTADIAAQASLTGHIVFSTLHTNDAAGAIPRLVNMGVRPYTIGPALSVVIGQRLVRKLCDKCRESLKADEKLIKEFKNKLGKFYPKNEVKEIYQANKKGCHDCHETGYAGRMGIYEIFQVDEKMETLINQRASSLDIFQAAVEQGMMTMEQDGILKVIEGTTDLEEVRRVVD
jgi:type IV pilus assembly protein PilB